MRISDWSSDVCSSDLGARCGGRARPAVGQRFGRGSHARPGARQGVRDCAAAGACIRSDEGAQGGRTGSALPARARGEPAPRAGAAFPLDRKSVEQGKSVSVSVDRGGRRIIKKKKKKKT